MRYFSEREGNEGPRDSEEISDVVWLGIRALIRARVEDGSFGATYRDNCSDGPVAIGTDEATLKDAMRAQIPGLPDWPWRGDGGWSHAVEVPSTIQILDMVEFCWASIGKPISRDYHDFGRHNHLRFDVEAGRECFRTEIETIFRRNGIAYVLTQDGRIERQVPPVFRGVLDEPEFDTKDSELDRLLDTAVRKFIDPRPERVGKR